jgi:DNA-binding response OmpR family regulator
MGEFLARARSALRRAARAGWRWDGALRVGELVIDVEAHRVVVAGREIDLTPREFALLRVLAERHGSVIQRRQLLQTVWGPDFFGDDGVLDVYVRTLRKKVEPDPSCPSYILTVRGIGYRLEAPAADSIAS